MRKMFTNSELMMALIAERQREIVTETDRYRLLSAARRARLARRSRPAAANTAPTAGLLGVANENNVESTYAKKANLSGCHQHAAPAR